MDTFLSSLIELEEIVINAQFRCGENSKCLARIELQRFQTRCCYRINCLIEAGEIVEAEKVQNLFRSTEYFKSVVEGMPF